MNISRLRSFARRFRFSLRVLLIATTICCIVFGVLAERWRRVSQAVSHIQKAGVHVTYDYERDIGFMHGKEFERALEESRRYHWLRNILYFPERFWIDLDRSDSELTVIFREGARIGTIQQVIVFNDNFSNEDAIQLCRFPHLRSLDVHSDALTSRGAARLMEHPRLRHLELDGCRNVNDSIIEELGGRIPTGIVLSLDNTGITQAVVKRLTANP
jgi:hypothetical protein